VTGGGTAAIAQRLGLGTTVQTLPSQCSVIVRSGWRAVVKNPAAHASDDELAAIVDSRLVCSGPPGAGLATRRHEVPFQRSISVCSAPFLA
jgi:hypothetical protein